MRWLEQRRQPFQPPPPPPEAAMAIRAWNMLGGLDWAGLDVVMDVIGIDDPELLIAQLVVLRSNPEMLGDGQ
jgi:hypothetical protein